MADDLAKTAALMEGPSMRYALSKRVTDQKIEKLMENFWMNEWENSDSYKHTKLFFPTTRKKSSMAMMKQSKKKFSSLVRHFTDFNGLKKFNHRIGMSGISDNLCRLCTDDSNKQTENSEHLIFKCPKLNILRFNCLGYHQGEKPYRWTLDGIINFTQNKFVRALEENWEIDEPVLFWEDLAKINYKYDDARRKFEPMGIG